MKQNTSTVADRLFSKLPEDLEFIDPQWLGGFGIPPFVAESIRHTLLDKLRHSLNFPDTVWTDLDANPVRTSWERFVEAAEAEIRLPYSSARDVMVSVAADLTGILTEPRKNLPDFLFGNEKSLNFREASDRVTKIVVYTHFGQQLPNYMRRKQLDFIDRERYASFISQLDEKLTAHYSPLNWAQLLAPLFELMEDRVEPAMLSAFFRDKNRDDLAIRFDGLPEEISAVNLKEVLAAPSPERTVTGKPAAINAEPGQPAMPATDKNEAARKAEPVPVTPHFRNAQTIESRTESKPESVAIPPQISETSGDQTSETAEEHDYAPSPQGNQTQTQIDPEIVSGIPPSRTENDEVPLVERFRIEESDRKTEIEPTGTAPAAEVSDETANKKDNTDESVPMWKRFISAAASVATGKTTEPSDASQEKALIEKLAAPEEDYELDIEYINPLRIDQIKKTLDDRKKYYIKRFFKGDHAAFNTVVRDLSEMETWKEAGPYVTKNVFKKYKIDPLSDEAVDFMDRLQSFFTSHQS
jgi:hypothetical protein